MVFSTILMSSGISFYVIISLVCHSFSHYMRLVNHWLHFSEEEVENVDGNWQNWTDRDLLGQLGDNLGLFRVTWGQLRVVVSK